MMRNKLFTLGVSIVMLLCALSARGEVYTLDEAREMYKAGKYEEAAPTFAREVKRKPNNGSVNHWYGVCLYEMGDSEGAIPYLKKGASRKVTLSNLYLGKAYAALYRFDEAIESIEAYIEILSDDDKQPSEDVQRLLSSAKLGKRMMRGVEQVQVIDSITVDSLSFFDHYRLSPEAGRIIGYDHLPQELQAENIEVAFMPQRADVLYMGRLEADQYDLYQSGRLLKGSWSESHPLSETLNTPDNQNYPYLLSDGQTLYFAQDGESSLGGYDIFVTMFNSDRGDFMLPQNMGMPFNSPYNDYMMAIDETLGVGWFVTDRNQLPGQLTIYLFIPNADKQVYEDVEDEQLCKLAQLASIADTWQEGSDYTSLLTAIDNIKEVEDNEMREFTFVLCNGIVYTSSDDFQSEAALRYYNQARSEQSMLDKKKSHLQALRKQYSVADKAEKKQLSVEILALEKELLNKSNQALMYENRARTAELTFRNIQND